MSAETVSGVVVGLRAVSLDFAGVPVLVELSLRAGAGDVICLRGNNGSGKTSLLRILANVARPTSGKRVGVASCAYVPATFDPVPMRVGEWLTLLPRHNRGNVSAMLDELGFDSDPAKKLADLSFGNLRKLMLAEAMTSGETLLVIDEVTAGLDARGIEATCTQLQILAAAGCAIVSADQHDRPVPHGAKLFDLVEGSLRKRPMPSPGDDDVIAVEVRVKRSRLRALDNWLRSQGETSAP